MNCRTIRRRAGVQFRESRGIRRRQMRSNLQGSEDSLSHKEAKLAFK